MKKILVIDDNPTMRDLVKDILDKGGFEITLAEDGVDGINKLNESTPEVVITDIVMPNKEGFETISDIRASNPQIYIIAMSGGGTMDKEVLLDIAEKLGAHKTLKKPFQPSMLLETVNSLLSTKH